MLRRIAHSALVIYLLGIFVIWFFTTDYLGSVPDDVAGAMGLEEFKEDLRSHFYRPYVY